MGLRVLVSGAGGRMGQHVVRAVAAADDLELVGAVDPAFAGRDAGELAGVAGLRLPVAGDLAKAAASIRPDVVVDFTHPQAVMENARTVVGAGLHMVIGTTGLSEQNLQELHKLALAREVGVMHAPNFAVGAVLMMRFAREAARFFPGVEIIELHHDQKKDAPSGTAVKTAEMIGETWRGNGHDPTEEIKLAGARGGELGGVRVHSIRLPGLVAHQEVLFGGAGETLTIRHDSLDRVSFMPGVLLAVRKVKEFRGLVYGLEHLLFSDQAGGDITPQLDGQAGAVEHPAVCAQVGATSSRGI